MLTIDKLYIDGPCGSKTLAGFLLARFERVNHMTHFYRYAGPIGAVGIQYGWIKCLQYDWAAQKGTAYNSSIDFRKSNSHGPSTYTLSMVLTISNHWVSIYFVLYGA